VGVQIGVLAHLILGTVVLVVVKVIMLLREAVPQIKVMMVELIVQAG
jgi:hypothetical protein